MEWSEKRSRNDRMIICQSGNIDITITELIFQLTENPTVIWVTDMSYAEYRQIGSNTKQIIIELEPLLHKYYN